MDVKKQKIGVKSKKSLKSTKHKNKVAHQTKFKKLGQ